MSEEPRGGAPERRASAAPELPFAALVLERGLGPGLSTTSIARASPSTSSEMMRSCFWLLAMASRTGRRSFMLEIFFSEMRMYASSMLTFMPSGSVTK